MNDFSDKIVFGKSDLLNVVSVEASDGHLEVFTEVNGIVKSQFIENKYWLLANEKLDSRFIRLKGDLHYKWGKQFDKRENFLKARRQYKNHKTYSIYDPRESSLVNKGISYYKGMIPQDVSTLAFDLETTGLKLDSTAKILLIANTFRKNGKIERKLFCYDDYPDEGAMIKAWCSFVREKNPSILCGHNILSFDFKYLKYIADKFGVSLDLGRDGSPLEYYKYESKFRIDGSREQLFNNVRCYGREIFDSYFALVKWDIGKELDSYGLKPAIKHFQLEVKDRQFYDAGQIRNTYTNPIEWAKIKKYAIHDGDDALNILDKIIPTSFYIAQSVPKSFQQVVLSASGAQINSILLRAYIQDGHSIPKAEENMDRVIGGISFGVPGSYKNVYKLDIKSAYPSQIIRFNLYDKNKDPKGYFLYITKYFTHKRLELKELLEKQFDVQLKAMDDSSKVFINSMYGLTQTFGLNFNSSKLAQKITTETREIIKFSILWASGKSIDSWWEGADEP
jgi:DNA polymerase I